MMGPWAQHGDIKILEHIPSLQLTKIRPPIFFLAKTQKEMNRLPTIDFQGQTVSFRDVFVFFSPSFEVSLSHHNFCEVLSI